MSKTLNEVLKMVQLILGDEIEIVEPSPASTLTEKERIAAIRGLPVSNFVLDESCQDTAPHKEIPLVIKKDWDGTLYIF